MLYIAAFLLLYLFMCFHQFLAFGRQYGQLAFTALINHFQYSDQQFQFEQVQAPKLKQMETAHFLAMNVLVAMFALAEAFEKQKKMIKEKERKEEEEIIQKDKTLTKKEKKAKIKKL